MAYVNHQHGPSRPPETRDGSISPRPLDSPPERSRSISGTLNLLARTRQVLSNVECPRAIAFHKLPPDIISRVLWVVDSDSFASLCMLNRNWHKESEKVGLYAHHLSRCPSYALSHNLLVGPFRRNDLFRFKARFAAEVRRNLFNAYLGPRETRINLISISASSSAAFPGGEAFRFAFSPNGQTLLALSSSRIFVIDLLSDPVVVRNELKTLRRPLAASVTDDGSLLAVLSSTNQANVYALTPTSVKHLQVIVLDNPPRTIALAHEGTVLAAAYETGVEVFSLAANALSTDRRAVRCEAVDSLDFSGDGSMLVGSSQGADDPNAVVISAPFYAENDSDVTPRELHSRQWTTQILFPNNSASISHAALIPNHVEGDANWLFAFDHMLHSYRAVRTDDTRTGIAYFLSPSISRRFSTPCPGTAPATSACGDLVAAGFHGLGLWLYGVPERLDVSPDMGSVIERNEVRMHGRMALTSATGHPEPLMAYSPSISGSTESIDDDSLAGKVDWRQSLFVKCKRIQGLEGQTAMKWVEEGGLNVRGPYGKRLVVVAPGGVSAFGEDLGDSQNMPVDGGRLMLLDFEYAPSKQPNREITIELGEGEPHLLEEHHGNLDTEVAMERRRTIRQAPAGANRRSSLGRSVTAITPSTGAQAFFEQYYRQDGISQPSSPTDQRTPMGQDIGSPYVPAQPRPQDFLHRAATATGVYRARFPARPPLGTPQGPDPRRRTGSNDSWETPPPPYTPPPVGSTIPADTQAFRGGPAPSPIPRPLASPMTAPQQMLSPEPMASQPRAPTEVPAFSIVPFSDFPNEHPLVDYSQLAPPHRISTEPIRRAVELYHSPPRANTTIERTTAPENFPSRFASLRAFRQRGVSDSNLQTVTELGTFQTTDGVLSNPMHSASATSSPVPSEQSRITRRRPVSHDGTNRLSNIPLNLSATILHPVSPPTPDLDPMEMLQNPGASFGGPVHRPSVSLSGANLQNRLNHPTPPAPSASEQQRGAAYIPPNLQVGHPALPALLPPDRNAEPFTLVPPTAMQMANPSRRQSRDRSGQVARATGVPFASDTDGHDFGRVSHIAQDYRSPPTPQDLSRMSPSRSHAAWGAAGVPGSPSFDRATSTSQGMLRPDSRHGQRSATASAPDLLAQRFPHVGLDAIGGVQTAYAETAYGIRSRSRSETQGGHPPMQYMSPHMDARDTTVDPHFDKTRKKEKKRKQPNGNSDPRSTYGEKKGSRCIVM